jgi:hypothetical protein
MVHIWNTKVYFKIRTHLTEAFVKVLERRRGGELEKLKTLYGEEKESMECDLYERDYELELIGTFIQFIADLSINEITVHYLGSTKMMLTDPYLELHRVVISETEYYV